MSFMPNEHNFIEVIQHHLHLFGFGDEHNITVLYRPNRDQIQRAKVLLDQQQPLCVIQPQADFAQAFAINLINHAHLPPYSFKLINHATEVNFKLRTLHPWQAFSHNNSKALLQDNNEQEVWSWLTIGESKMLCIGTDLVQDLIRYRQGDSQQVATAEQGARWGFDFERPNYLFEAQLQGEDPYARFADYWAGFLSELLAHQFKLARQSLLPHNAKGAVILTGDDDQAYLEKYQAQLELIKDTPITYFMHPLTRHTRKTVKSMLRREQIDLGLHPDALEAPQNYHKLLLKQAKWFNKLFKQRALSVRNHGFLNAGYWQHLPSWLQADIQFSSNLPGLTGQVLNGSLLPARLFYQGQLTQHWSILTAIGDGVMFALKDTPAQAAQRIYDLADSIVHSHLPGIIVLNLHPQNVDTTVNMHQAVLELIADGFYPMTMRECLQWFGEKNEIQTKN